MIDACWKKVGAEGDSSCPKLADLAHCRNCPEYVRAGRALFDREIPERDRREWAAQLAEEKQDPGQSASYMVFRVANEWLALPLTALEQVVEERPVHTVPGRSNRGFRGLVNIDGELLLCYSAAHLLGLSDAAQPVRMLVVAQGGNRMVISADEVLGVVRVTSDALARPPATVVKSPSALTASVFAAGDKHVALIDADRWLQSAARSLA